VSAHCCLAALPTRHVPRCCCCLRIVVVSAPVRCTLCAAAGPVRVRLCRAHVAGLVVALSLMALRRAGHVGRERACLSASAWPQATPVVPTASHQGTPLLSHWLPLPHHSLALSLCSRRPTTVESHRRHSYEGSPLINPSCPCLRPHVPSPAIPMPL